MKQTRSGFTVYMSEGTKQLFLEAAEQRDMSLSTWLVQAGLSYARSAKRSEGKNAEAKRYPSGWPVAVKCFHCNKRHDPAEHIDAFPSGISEFLHLAEVSHG